VFSRSASLGNLSFKERIAVESSSPLLIGYFIIEEFSPLTAPSKKTI